MEIGGAQTTLYKSMGLVGLLLWTLAFSANGQNASSMEPEKQVSSKRSKDVPATIVSDLNRVTSVFPSDTVFRTLSNESATTTVDGLVMGASTSVLHVTSMSSIQPEGGELEDEVSLESSSEEEANSTIQDDVPLNNTHSSTASSVVDSLLESSMNLNISVTPFQTVIPVKNTANDTTVPVRTAISNSSFVTVSESSSVGSSFIRTSSWDYDSTLLQDDDLDELLTQLKSTSVTSSSSVLSQTVIPTTLTILYFPSIVPTPSLNTYNFDVASLTNHSMLLLPKSNLISKLPSSSTLLPSSTASTRQSLGTSEFLQLTPSSSMFASISEEISSTTQSNSLATSEEEFEEDELLLGDWRISQAKLSNHDSPVIQDETASSNSATFGESKINSTKKVQRRPVPLATIITNSNTPISPSSTFLSNDIQPSFSSTSSYTHEPTSAIQTAILDQIDSALFAIKVNGTNSVASSTVNAQSAMPPENGTQTAVSSASEKFTDTKIRPKASSVFNSRLPATTSLLFYTQILGEDSDQVAPSVNLESSQFHSKLENVPQTINPQSISVQSTPSYLSNNISRTSISEIPLIRKLANINNGKLIHTNSHLPGGNGSLHDMNTKQKPNNSNTLKELDISEKLPEVNDQEEDTSTSTPDISDDIANFQAEYFPDYNTQNYKDDTADEVYDWPPVALDEDSAYHFRGDGNDYDGEPPDYNSEAIAFSAVLLEEELQSRSTAATEDLEPTPNVPSVEPPTLPVVYDPLLVVTSTRSLPEPSTSKRDVRSVPESMASTSPAPPDITSSAMATDSGSITSSDIASSSPIKDKINRYSSLALPEIQLEPSPSVQETNQTSSLETTPIESSVLSTGIPHPNSSRMPFSNRATPHKKQNIDEIITGLKQILGNNVQVASSVSGLAPTTESDSTRINNRGPPRFPENDQILAAASPESHDQFLSASPIVSAESVSSSTVTQVTLEVDAWQPSPSNIDNSDTKTHFVDTQNHEIHPETKPQPLLADENAGSSQSIQTRPVPFVPDLEASLQEVHYTESSVIALSSMNLLSSRFGVNFSYTRLPPRPIQDQVQGQQAPVPVQPVQEETLTEVVHEPESISTSSSEFVPSGPITEWVPVYLHPQVHLSTSLAGSSSGSSAIPSRDVPYAGIPPVYRPSNPASNLQPYDVVNSNTRPGLTTDNNRGSSVDSPRPYMEKVGASGNVQNPPSPNVPSEAQLPGRRPGVVLPADPNEPTPLLPSKRPDWPQRNPSEVVHDTREPAPEPVLADDVGQVFDVTLTATGVMAQGNTGATGRPYVVPVDIDDVHVGNRPPSGPPIVSADGADDQSVFIDGRRTYFNLNPTDVGGAEGNNGGATRVIGVGMNIDDGNSGPNRTPVRTPPRVVRPPSASVNKPNRIRTTTPLIRIDTCIVGDESACDAEHHEVCRTEAGVSSCMCRPGFAHSTNKNTCTAVVALLLYLRLDRLDNQRLVFSSPYEDSSSPESQTMEREVVRALDSAFRMTSLGRVYAGVTFNKFYALGGKLAVNVTLMLEETTQTRNHRIKQEVSKELVAVIQQRSQNVGVSRLYVDAQFSPIPGVQDVNECSDSELNDCSPNARCDNILGSFKCSCQAGFTDKYENNPLRSGRICSVCSPEYCNNHGECTLTDGKQECQCKGSYIGSRCEIDGEVLGVALGASLAALLIIILTLVCLCMWSRRWKKDQQKTDMRSSCQAYTTYANKNAQALTHHVSLEDRIRWAHIADAMSNYYTTDPLNRGPTPLALPPTNTPPPPPTSAPPCAKYQQTQLSRSRTSLIDDDDEALEDANRFHVPRPKSRSSYNQSQNIYYDVDYSARDNFPGTLRGSALNAYPLQTMRPYYS